MTFRTEPEYDPVTHDFFLARDARSTTSDRYSPFNRWLYVSCRFPDRIVSIRRGMLIVVDADEQMTTTPLTPAECRRVMVEELGISEAVAHRVPPDEVDPSAPT